MAVVLLQERLENLLSSGLPTLRVGSEVIFDNAGKFLGVHRLDKIVGGAVLQCAQRQP